MIVVITQKNKTTGFVSSYILPAEMLTEEKMNEISANAEKRSLETKFDFIE